MTDFTEVLKTIIGSLPEMKDRTIEIVSYVHEAHYVIVFCKYSWHTGKMLEREIYIHPTRLLEYMISGK